MDRLALVCFWGAIVFTAPADPTIQPAVFYYQRVDPADIPTLNRHRLVVMNYLPGQAAIFSQVSPDTKVIYYHLPCMVVGNTSEWTEVNANESWFLHDGLGQRIRFPGSNDTYPHYYTDVSNPEYLAFKIARYQGLLGQYPWMDGFYLDFPSTYQGFDLYTRPELDCANDIPAGNSLPAPFTSQAAWDAFYAPALASIKAALGTGVIVVANDWLYGPLSEAAGGGFGEHMFHFYWGGRFYSEASWRQQVDLLAAPSLADRTSLVLSTMAPTDDFERSIRFSVASFLLGKRMDSDAYFAFRDSPNSADPPRHHALYDIDLGDALSVYEMTGGAYARRYERGFVVVNPTAGAKTVAVSPVSGWVDLDGAPMGSLVVLESNTAQIFSPAVAVSPGSSSGGGCR